jgi:hypothetical protein
MATSKVAPPQHSSDSKLRQGARIDAGDIGDVMGAHAGGEQRLVAVAHGGVGEEHAVFVAHPFGEALRPSASRRCFEPSGMGAST